MQLGLGGRFQNRNAALSIAVAERLAEKGFRIPSRAIHDGLKKAFWPGRMHVVAKRPIIILDGAHNPAAAAALRESIREEFSYRRLILVVGVMEDKEIGQLLRAIVPLADYVIYTRPVYHRAASPEVLAAKGATLGKPGETVPLLTRAIDRAKEMADPQDVILVCGSLFTVGEALTYFDPVTYRPDAL
jgi:dihydrofolate synthase/folylpolyglutamate synthase